MPRPTGRIPYEIFGFSTGEVLNAKEIEDIDRQHCPFLNSECTKFRKSDPKVKIGSCALGHKEQPVIICPERFKVPVVFKTIEDRYFGGREATWVPEVSLGDRGNIDYVAALPNGKRDLDDFLCVEIQANGTTGTPWPRIEHFRTRHTMKGAPKATYGFNWANEYTKTLTQQLLKKGRLIEGWKKKIVVVIQDSGIDYIRKQGQGVRDYHKEDSVHFMPFSMEYQCDKWVLSISHKEYSANMDGIIQSLTSESIDPISVDEFQQQILEKGDRAKLWPWS